MKMMISRGQQNYLHDKHCLYTNTVFFFAAKKLLSKD